MKQRAHVERFKAITVGDLRTKERAALPCGCAIYVGLTPAGKAATAAQPCPAKGHELITDRSSGLLRELIQTPAPGRLLVDACRIALTQAARETS